MATDFSLDAALDSPAIDFTGARQEMVATWPNEPMRFREEDMDPLFLWCVEHRASDITIQTDRPIYMEVDGALRTATRRAIDGADMTVFLARLYGADASAKLASGRDLDLSYEIRPDRMTRIRFRVNMTAILSRGRDAVQVTMRALPSLPPTMEQLNIEPEIIANWAPRQGLILVTGPTGSGKSTLLAAGNRMLIERAEGCGKMLTYEAPIEYVYDAIASEKSLVSQTEIPRHLPDFAAGVRNALRRKPNIIQVGEVRDRETVTAAVEAGQTGHAVYTTAHTIGVAATIRRMMSMFDSNERVERGYAMMETMRMVVTQALVPKIGGGRVGVREYMVFTDEIREQLLSTAIDNWSVDITNALPRLGRSMGEAARLLYDAGGIEKRWHTLLEKSTGVH